MKMIDQLHIILGRNEKARNSDKELILEYFALNGLRLTPEQQEIFFKLNSVESVRRTRQKLQQEGYYPATTNVKMMRDRKEQVIEQNIPKAKPKDVERLFSDQEIKKAKPFWEYDITRKRRTS